LLHGSDRKRKLHSVCEGTQELLLLLPINLSNAGTFLPWIVRGEEESEEFHLQNGGGPLRTAFHYTCLNFFTAYIRETDLDVGVE
jgi:hypothetical protein